MDGLYVRLFFLKVIDMCLHLSSSQKNYFY
jgi:hypothetical protein